MNKIRNISTWGYVLSWVLAVLAVLIPIIVWLTAPDLFKQSNQPIAGLFYYYEWLPKVATHFSMKTKIEGFLIVLTPAILVFFCWLNAAGLFKSFRTSSIYTHHNVTRLRRIGWLLLISEILQFPMQAGLSAVLTIASGMGHGESVVNLNGLDFGIIAISVMLLLASWVIQEGVGLKQENEAII